MQNVKTYRMFENKHWTLLCLARTSFQQPATCIICSIENMNVHNTTKGLQYPENGN